MRQFWAFCVFLAAALSGFGQATLMVNTNTQRVLKPAPELFWMASRADMLTALDFGTEINAGVPNGLGATIHWSQLLGVPAGFADGTDDGGGGGGLITAVSADHQVSGGTLSITNTTGTGALLRASVLAPYLLSATASVTYQLADTDLDAIAALNGGALTNLSGSAIASGTVADARIAASIARLASPALTGTPTAPTAAPGTSNTTVATTAFVSAAVAASGGGGGGGGTSIAPNWYARTAAAGTNVVILPQPVDTTTASTWAPNFAAGKILRVVLNGDLTLSAPTGVTEDMIGQTFLLQLVQDSTGGRSVTSVDSAYKTGSEITGIGLSTNANSRSYVPVIVVTTNQFDIVGSITGYQP